MAQASPSSNAGSNALQLALYWAIVAVPLGWGIYKTVQKSLPLFSPATAVASPTPAAREISATPVPAATPLVTPMPTATAMPYGTTQPFATVAPIVTPAQPIN